jgi:predicted DNA-binding transcriptional regulator AlpA
MPYIPVDQQIPIGEISEYFLPAAKVRGRYNVSDMSLWRWLKDPALNFPEPIRINGRRFWRLSNLETWEKSRGEL